MYMFSSSCELVFIFLLQKEHPLWAAIGKAEVGTRHEYSIPDFMKTFCEKSLKSNTFLFIL